MDNNKLIFMITKNTIKGLIVQRVGWTATTILPTKHSIERDLVQDKILLRWKKVGIYHFGVRLGIARIGIASDRQLNNQLRLMRYNRKYFKKLPIKVCSVWLENAWPSHSPGLLLRSFDERASELGTSITLSLELNSLKHVDNSISNHLGTILTHLKIMTR